MTVLWPPKCEEPECDAPAVFRMFRMNDEDILTSYWCEEHYHRQIDYFTNPWHGETFGYVVLDVKLVEDCKGPDARRDLLKAVIRYDAGEPAPFDGWQGLGEWTREA